MEAGESDEDEDAFVLFEEESQGDNDEDDDNVDDFCQTTEGLESGILQETFISRPFMPKKFAKKTMIFIWSLFHFRIHFFNCRRMELEEF